MTSNAPTAMHAKPGKQKKSVKGMPATIIKWPKILNMMWPTHDNAARRRQGKTDGQKATPRSRRVTYLTPIPVKTWAVLVLPKMFW